MANKLLIATALATTLGMTAFAAAGATPLNDPSLATPRFGAWGIDLKGMDTAVKPGDNFFDYVNGTADRTMVIPADKTSNGVNEVLEDLSEARSRAIVEDLASKASLSGDDKKIADLYNSMMDEKTVEARDATPLAPALADIRAIATKSQMAAYMGKTSGTFGGAIFGAGISADAKNPKINVLSLGQAGLGLPDRDYYLDAAYADKLKAYEAYVARLLGMTGYPDATRHAHAIVAFETAIARVSWTRAEDRDPIKTYNPMTLAAVAKLAPGFDWNAYFKTAGVSGARKAVVGEKSAFPKIAKVFADTPLDTLKAWEAFHVVDQAAPYLSKRFVDARWQFRSHELGGAEEQRPRWKRAVGLVEDSLGEALGRDYVVLYFPPESKAKMQEIVGYFHEALKHRIENVSWMSAATKQKALEKLSKMNAKIGYPDRWRDYSKLEIAAGDLYGNVDRASRFEWNRSLAKLDKPVDPLEWDMTPQTVNAYYDPTKNEIVLPAAELQAPFFDPNADDAVNYGGIGASTIGHEITHGFDDEGRHYDGDGKLSEWWTDEDSKRFEAEANKYAQQFDAFEPLPGLHIKGDQTLGENIADLGGILIALDAYHLSQHGKTPAVIDGFDGDQRLLISYAQSWQGKIRDDTLKMLLVADVHSPYAFRVIGPMRNVDAWYTEFKVQPGDKYYLKPEDRVRIW
ncbi:M13 family metallopeptidase [Asticcacaulis solisilvae]|uniref:M13 family metallopeptidase n=1 Tax=Asticcacaulis solisilvae TaxID=1217274 RepID=UPI003FD6C17C